MGDKVGENPAALRAAVFFFAILEKPEGGGGAFKRPPPAGRGLSFSPRSLEIPSLKIPAPSPGWDTGFTLNVVGYPPPNNRIRPMIGGAFLILLLSD